MEDQSIRIRNRKASVFIRLKFQKQKIPLSDCIVSATRLYKICMQSHIVDFEGRFQ